MKFAEEDYAERLHDVLGHQSMLRGVPFRFALSGAGVHWRCEASSDTRAVAIHCFDENHEPEYYAEFRTEGRVSATARTPIQRQVVGAAFDWLGGMSVGELHSGYPFVDGLRRALEAVEKALRNAIPTLATVSCRMKPLLCDLYELWFENGDRDVKVCFHDKNPEPDFTLRWDKCEISETRSDDIPMMGRVIESWLVEQAAPAEMRNRFPAVALSKVADFYAAGRPIEGEFLESWDEIEEFYLRNDGWPGQRNAALFVEAARRAGYDRTLRAGQSLYTLMLSRSRRHGLRTGQPHLQFWFSDSWAKVVASFGEEKGFQFKELPLNPAIVGLMDRLVAFPID